MNAITIKKVSKEHSYIVLEDRWLATTHNDFAELVLAAFQAKLPQPADPSKEAA